MDLSNPLRSLAPTVDADVLAVLARTHTSLTGAQVQRLAGRSYAQVRHTLQRLAAHGLVDSERHGQAYSYTLNRQHVLADAVEVAAAGGATAEARLRLHLTTWNPAPAAAALFGSFARQDGGSDSDIDLLLIRDDAIQEDDQAWSAQRYEVARHLQRWTGNTVQIVELSLAELRSAIWRQEPLIAEVRRDGLAVAGPDLSILLLRDRRKSQ
jgi:predicted nucleotidyltransferase